MTSIDTNIKVKKVSQTLSDAADKAAEQLRRKTPLPSILIVENEANCILMVATHQNRLGVYRVDEAGAKMLHLVPGDKYRALLFEECRDVKVVVLSKLLKCSFVRASGCSILICSLLIGALEFFKCNQSDVTLQQPLNLVQVNSCSRIRFFHGDECLDPVLYVINLSMDISCGGRENEIILVNTFDNLLNQRIVTVHTTDSGGPPILEGGVLPVYIQEITQMVFWDDKS